MGFAALYPSDELLEGASRCQRTCNSSCGVIFWKSVTSASICIRQQHATFRHHPPYFFMPE
jgi:hypothetical protein